MKKSNKQLYLIYTIVFLLMIFACYASYIMQGKSLVFDGDGYSQHLKALIYYSEYLKNFFYNIFVNHSFILPQWDFSFGEGADILGTLNYYVIGDPIAFLSVLIPKKYIYLYYNFSIILRLYLSGVCFSFLCKEFGNKNNNAILCGMFVYAFCFWNLYNSVRHIYFLNPMIYFPLVIIGVEKVIKQNKPYLLSVFVALSALSNFYFFTNIVILTIVYVAVRLLTLYRNNISEIIKCIFNLFKHSIIGVLISSIILFPVIFFYLNDGRVGVDVGVHLTYPIFYYLKLPSTFLSTSRNYWLCMGFASPALIGIILCLKNYRNNAECSILFIISMLFILFPIFGQLFNAMSYISNKWCFGFALLVAYILTDQWESLVENRKILLIAFLPIFVLCTLFSGISVIVSLILGLIFLITCFCENKIRYTDYIRFALVLINICFIANWQFSSLGSNYSRTATYLSDNKSILNESEAYFVSEEITDEDFYRYSGPFLTSNASVLFNTHSTDYYWSLANPNVSEYRDSLELEEYSLYKYTEYSKHPILYSLANVRYYITPEKYSGYVPYGFVLSKSSDGYDIYSNQNELPFGYTYKETLDKKVWDSLNPVEKEFSLLDYVVLEGGDSHADDYGVKPINFSITSTNNVTVKENLFITEDDSNITLTINEDCGEGVVYLRVTGLYYDDGQSWLKEKTEIAGLEINYGDIYKWLTIYSRDNRYYNGRKDFTFCLGEYNSDYGDEITLKFNQKGFYDYSTIEIFLADTTNIDDKIATLAQKSLQNVTFDINAVSGDITVSDDSYLLLSIPYSEGWKAYVDGEEAEVLKANICYSAVKLTSGNHNVILKYNTPYLNAGTLLSCLGCVLLIYEIRKFKKPTRQQNE